MALATVASNFWQVSRCPNYNEEIGISQRDDSPICLGAFVVMGCFNSSNGQINELYQEYSFILMSYQIHRKNDIESGKQYL